MTPARRVERIRFTNRSAAVAVALLFAAVAVLGIVSQSARVIGWILAAAALAGFMHPFVERLAHYMPRGLALAIVVVIGLGAIGGAAYRVVDSITDEWRKLEAAAPREAKKLEESGRFSTAAREFHLERRTRQFVKNVPQRLRGGTPTEAVRAAATRSVAFLVTAILALFFQLHGPRIAAAGARQIRDAGRREQAERVATRAFRRSFGYARGMVAIAVVAGLVAFVIATLADVPGPAPLALWVGLWDVVPLIGAAIGALPIVILAAIASPVRGIVAGLAFVAYQGIENVVLQRRAERETIRLGPFITVVASLVGLEVRGIGGALIALLAVAVATAVVDELAPAA
jgi:predicted PurR-regulated permease PerM